MTEILASLPTDLNILNVKLLGNPLPQNVLIREGYVSEIIPYNSRQLGSEEERIDGEGDWLTLGGYDLQINGVLGLAFTDVQNKHLPLLKKICTFLWQQGVDAFVPTIVTTSVEKIQESLSVFKTFMTEQTEGVFAELNLPQAKVLGIHLEGPFLNVEKRGAHPSQYLLPLTIDNVKKVLGDYTNLIKIITLAPELDPSGDVISYLCQQGIIVSLGHCQATSNQARQAFSQGAKMVTHAFNAMPSLHHREPGLLGAAMTEPGIFCGLIADGQHVCTTMMDILLQVCQYERGIFLVSDALAPLGLPDGLYPWDQRQIEVKNGTAWLRLDYHTPIEYSTLAGTTQSLLTGVQNLVNWGICSPERAILMATETPRKALGISTQMLGQSLQNLLRWRFKTSSQLLTWNRVI